MYKPDYECKWSRNTHQFLHNHNVANAWNGDSSRRGEIYRALIYHATFIVGRNELRLYDQYRRMQRHQLEQFQHVGVAHADTAMRMRRAHGLVIRRAVDVDVALHAVDIAETVEARLAAGKPEDARQNPVTLRILRTELWRPDFAGAATAAENAVDGLARADLGTDDMQAARGLVAVLLLACALERGRNRILGQQHACLVEHGQVLFGDGDFDFHQKILLTICPATCAMYETPAKFRPGCF